MPKSLVVATLKGCGVFRRWGATAYFVLTAAIGPLIIFSLNVHRVMVWNAVVGFALLFGGLIAVRIAAAIVFRRPSVSDPVIALAAIGLFYNGFVGAHPGTLAFWLWITAPTGLIAAVLLLGSRFREKLERILTMFLAALTATLLVNVLRDDVWTNRDTLRTALDENYPPIPLPDNIASLRPDIFYIVFDRYARADILAEHYDYDNTAFLDALRSRGFAISEDAFGTYQRTAHSLTSVLNMDYIPQIRIPSHDWVPLYEKLSASRLFSFLGSAGYRIRTYGSWWEPTRASPLAHFNDAYFAVPESLRPLSENSILARILAASGIDIFDPRRRHCGRLHHKFDALKGLAPTDEPIFVFAHFLVPHPPFVIDADGRCKSIPETKSLTRVENYAAQVTFTNSAALELVDTLIASNPNAVIIMQADEGPWPKKYAGEEIESFGLDVSSPNWPDIPADELREKMAILSAIRMPGNVGAEFEFEFAPVNTFRIILREIFGVPLPNLPRRALIFRNDNALYDFQDVLEKLNGTNGSL